MEVEVNLPVRKKVKKAEKVDKDKMTEGAFRKVIVGILERMEMRLRQQAAEVSHHIRAAELINVLLQHLIALLGLVGHGDMPAEGTWKMEDKTEGSEYKMDESLEVEVVIELEEESGKLGEEE